MLVWSQNVHSLSVHNQLHLSYSLCRLEISAPLNDSNLTITRLKIPHLGVANIAESQSSLHFALRVDQPFYWNNKVHWITTTWHWIIILQRQSQFVLLLSPSPKFHFVSFYGQPFSSYRYMLSSDTCTGWLQNAIDHYKVKDIPYELLVPQIQNIAYSMASAFRDMRLFKDKCTEWP